MNIIIHKRKQIEGVVFRVLCLFIVFHSQVGRTQIAQNEDGIDHKYVSNICYNQSINSHIKVISDLDFESLRFLDKMKFVKKSMFVKHKEYFSESGFATHDTHIQNHSKMFPKWYATPTLTRSDETGIKSFYKSDFRHLSSGWNGGTLTAADPGTGEYIEDKSEGTKYYLIPYGKDGGSAFMDFHERSLAFGFLKKYTYSLPTMDQIKLLESEGYSITYSDDLIVARGLKTSYVLNQKDKIYIEQESEDGNVIKTTTKKYKYNETIGYDLIFTTEVITPGTFTNGDCYEEIELTTYNDFSIDCKDGSLMKPRSEELDMQELLVYPNPASTEIIVDVSNISSHSTLMLKDISGSIIMQRKIRDAAKKITLDIAQIPNGVYIIEMKSSDASMNSKFIKQ